MPSPTTGIVSAQYLSAIDSMWLDVDFDPRLMDVRRNREFLDIMKGMGGVLDLAKENKRESIYYGAYNNPLNQAINTTGATITGNGTSATPFDVSVLPAGSQGVVAVGDILTIPSGKNVRVMTVASASAFTARTVDGTSTTWTAGQYATNTSQASESGSNAPTAKRWGITSISNLIQVIRSTTAETDIAAVSAVRTKVDGKFYETPYESIQVATLQYGRIMGAIMQGQIGNTLFTDASPSMTGDNGRGIQTTRGLEQYCTSFGVNDTVTTTGTVVLQDLADMINLLVAARSPKDYWILSSTAIGILYSNLLKNLPSSGAVNSVRMNIDGKSVDLDVTKFEYGGFNFGLKSLGYLDNNEMVGSSATSLMTAAKKAFFVPMGMAPTVGGPAQSYMKLAILPEPVKGGSNRVTSMDGLITEIRYGGLADTATNGNRTLDINMTSQVGLWLNDPQAFAAQTVLA